MATNSRKNRILKNRLLIAFTLIAVVITLAGLVFYFELGAKNAHVKTYWDALWLLFVSMTTVGFGDIVPVTEGGKVIVVIGTVYGVLLVASLTATLASRFVERLVKKMNNLPSKLENHILILGWNENGQKILDNLDHECKITGEQRVVMAVRKDPFNLPENVYFVAGNPTRLDELKKIQADKAKTAVVLVDWIAESHNPDSEVVLTVLALKRLSKSIRVICEAINNENAEYLENAGADEIIIRSDISGDLLSRSVNNPGMAELVSEMLCARSPGPILRIPIPKRFFGLTFFELLKEVYQQNKSVPIALVRDTKIILNPKPDERVLEQDELFVLSSTGEYCMIN